MPARGQGGDRDGRGARHRRRDRAPAGGGGRAGRGSATCSQAEGERSRRELGAAARFERHDVTRRDDWEQLVAAALAAHGRVDVLVNNAACCTSARSSTPRGRAAALSRGEHGRPVPRHARGARADAPPGRRLDRERGLDRLAARHERRQRLRRVEVGAARAHQERGDGARARRHPRQLRVPGRRQSGDVRAVDEAARADFLDQTRAYRENRGIPGEAPLDRIAQAVVFFASDASLNCTGVDLPVDGGAHAGRFIPGFNRF